MDGYREWAGAEDVVRCWWEQRTSAGRVQRVVPDACSDILVYADGRAMLVGPTMEVALPWLAPGTHVRGLRFRTAAISAALGLPGEQIRDLTLPLSTVMSDRVARRVSEDIWAGRFPLCPEPVDRRVRHAVRRLSAGIDAMTVADEIGHTERHLRRLLLSHTGIGPKGVQRVGRFQRFLRAAETTAANLAGLAASAGYADQAHLSREVRGLTGLTPVALLRERRVAGWLPPE